MRECEEKNLDCENIGRGKLLLFLRYLTKKWKLCFIIFLIRLKGIKTTLLKSEIDLFPSSAVVCRYGAGRLYAY